MDVCTSVRGKSVRIINEAVSKNSPPTINAASVQPLLRYLPPQIHAGPSAVVDCQFTSTEMKMERENTQPFLDKPRL